MTPDAATQYTEKRSEIDRLLADIRTGLDDHVRGTLHFGHVADLNHWIEQLSHITDAINRRGEYSDGGS